MSKIIGALSMDVLREMSNRRINSLLMNSWLDKETVKDFIKMQGMWQHAPFTLQKLEVMISNEIAKRKTLYGV